MKNIRDIIDASDEPMLTERIQQFVDRWPPTSWETARSWYYGRGEVPYQKLVLFNAFGSLAEAEKEVGKKK
jgi:hypothetical protein